MRNLGTRSVSLLFATLMLSATSVSADEMNPSNAVTFFAIVEPNSFETVFTATIGETQTTPNELSDAIRANGDRVLRITSIHGFVFGTPIAPADTDYALAFVGACTNRFSVRAFGNGPIAFQGRGTVQVNYRPGLVASLLDNEALCLRSLIQSNQRVQIEVHGYLQERPASKK